MNLEQFIINGKVNLTFWEKLTHYSILFISTGLSAMGVGYMIFSKDSASFERALYLFCFCFTITVVFYFIQKRRLRFIIIETSLDEKQLAEVINYVSKRQNWKQISRSKNHYIAICNDTFLFGNYWGERITILYDDDKIFFNSICDPNKRSSVTAWNRNWYHAKIFKSAVILLEEHTLKIAQKKAS
mgnify:CR=1 FL=1